MLVTERDRLREDVLAVAELTDFNRASLIPILRKVKEKYRGVDSYAMQLIADVLGIHPVEVYAVATFYSFIQPRPTDAWSSVCAGRCPASWRARNAWPSSCSATLGIGFGETTPDQLFSLRKWANCMGMCDQGPSHAGQRDCIHPTDPREGARHHRRVQGSAGRTRDQASSGACDMSKDIKSITND